MFLEWMLHIITSCVVLLNLEEIGCRRGLYRTIGVGNDLSVVSKNLHNINLIRA